MTAVANPPTFPQINRPAWGTINGNGAMNSDEAGGRGMFVPRKSLPRSNSSSSISSNGSSASNASNITLASNGAQSNGTSLSATSDLSQWNSTGVPRNRPQQKGQWQLGKPEIQSRPQTMIASPNPLQPSPGQPQMNAQGIMRPPASDPMNAGQPVLFLLSLNGTFERKTISVPFAPDSLRIGRQTNQKTVPTPSNGFFDSKVLSRQHAEVFAERNGKVYIRDVKSSNGTFVNGTRLSPENRDSEPHELQTADHLELGIDIVSEDQKTVVHHKVAAKVEHSGFLNTSNNVMDMNFGDLDPANGSMMMPAGAVQMRGRVGSNASMNGGRMVPGGQGNLPNGMQPQRPFFLTPIATDQILKRLANEMRSAKLQAQDLNRTSSFINTLLSKDDIKELDKPDGFDLPKPPPPMINGNQLPFRADAKTRFSEPPAPPPQQPLPEKPDAPSLKRGPTERPKSGPPNSSPARQDNMSQIIQLTEALNNARRDIDTQSARMRELENMLQKEREARELAEDLAKRLEESSALSATHMNETAKPEVEDSVKEMSAVPAVTTEDPSADMTQEAADPAKETAASLQARIDTMEVQMQDMRESMDEWKRRCELAETERDDDRKTLAEMVVQLRAEEARRISQEQSRSRSRRGRLNKQEKAEDVAGVVTRQPVDDTKLSSQSDGAASDKEDTDATSLSRSTTLTTLSTKSGAAMPDQHLQATLPYASMVGVVLLGMGLMAYINGWQPQPAPLERS